VDNDRLSKIRTICLDAIKPIGNMQSDIVSKSLNQQIKFHQSLGARDVLDLILCIETLKGQLNNKVKPVSDKAQKFELTKLKFFRDINTDERVKILKVFGIIPADYDEFINEFAMRQLLEKLCSQLFTHDRVKGVSDEKIEADWIAWWGSNNLPVGVNELVDIKRRNGFILSGVRAGDYNWTHVFLAKEHHIVAYRNAISQDKGESV